MEHYLDCEQPVAEHLKYIAAWRKLTYPWPQLSFVGSPIFRPSLRPGRAPAQSESPLAQERIRFRISGFTSESRPRPVPLCQYRIRRTRRVSALRWNSDERNTKSGETNPLNILFMGAQLPTYRNFRNTASSRPCISTSDA